MYIVSKDTSKFQIIMDIFNEFSDNQVTIFVNTKKFADFVCAHLAKKGCKVSSFTGNTDKEESDKIIEKLQKREPIFSIATNVFS